MSADGPRLEVPDAVERDDLAVFCARAVRLDGAVPIRLRGVDGRVEAWAPTPFDTLVTRAVHGTVTPGDVTVAGSDLLAALSVVGGPSVDAGTRCDERWRAPLPPGATWSRIDDVPAAEVDALAERGVEAARAGEPSGRPSAALLDQMVLTVTPGDAPGDEARVPMRCVFALAGMGFLAGGGGEEEGVVRVSTGGSPGRDWLRLDARGGAVVRRRRASLVLRPV